jgi:tyrosyl-tRNA synthetase
LPNFSEKQMTNFVEELRWRGMLQDVIPGTEEHLLKEQTSGYIGFDPTSNSLGVGNLVQVMTLAHFQRAGHKPIALVGGATGMVGDPSGKSAERNLLTYDELQFNVEGQKKQLEKFLEFGKGGNAAEMVNNYDWFKDFSFLDFIRDTGKLITINYMLAKDSVKNRLDSGMSFTEFSYQLIQGYDFYHLYKHKNCKLQMGGSDQWGNITTGTEFIRRKCGGEAFALTTPLIKKADGTKFGKSESGNIWLDAEKTSPYKFYQFWLNASDIDAENYIKIFTFLNKEEIEALISENRNAPHLRLLQKTLADIITRFVHSDEALTAAKEASEILFGKATFEALNKISEQDLLSIFEGVPMATIAKSEIENTLGIIDLLVAKTNFLPSNSEARRSLKANAISVNKTKVTEETVISSDLLIRNKYLLLQSGKKNYFLVQAI